MRIFKHIGNHLIEFSFCEWFQWSNPNNHFLGLEFDYGCSNGYENRFFINFLCPWNWGVGIDKHNGHARAHFACGLLLCFLIIWIRKALLIKTFDNLLLFVIIKP